MEDDRRAAIDNENMILLNKMRNIFARGTIASHSGTARPPPEVEPRSLNQESRRRELERITRENLGIVQRIRSRKPNYSTAQYAKDRKEKEAVMRRMSKIGRRRSDYLVHSQVAGGSTTSSQVSSQAGGRNKAPRRLQAIDQPPHHYSSDGSLGGRTGPSFGGSGSTMAGYGDKQMNTPAPSVASQIASRSTMSVDQLRPAPMRILRSPAGGGQAAIPAQAYSPAVMTASVSEPMIGSTRSRRRWAI